MLMVRLQVFLLIKERYSRPPDSNPPITWHLVTSQSPRVDSGNFLAFVLYY